MLDFIECFLDDEFIAAHDNIVRRLCPAYKLRWNPVIRAEHPWEQADPPRLTAPSVVSNIGTADIAMYYRCSSPRGGRWTVCMAESADGRAWHKPALEIHRHGPRGERTNILCAPPPSADELLSFWAMRNPVPQESYDFLALVETMDPAGTRRVHIIGSQDPARWDLSRMHLILSRDDDCRPSLLYCGDGLFRAFLRAGGVSGLRAIEAIASGNLVEWTQPASLLSVTESEEKAGVRLLALSAARLGPFYVGLLSVIEAPEEALDADSAPTRVELAFSRDGVAWRRVCPGSPFLLPGEPGEWDAGMVCHCSGFFEIGDCWLLAYGAGPGRYGELASVNIGIAWTERGRLVGITQADPARPGTLVTAPVTIGGGSLVINADTPSGIRASLLTQDYEPIAGAEASKLERLDECRCLVKWTDENGQAAFSPLDAPVRIKFDIAEGAVLHSMETLREQGAPYKVNLRDVLQRPRSAI